MAESDLLQVLVFSITSFVSLTILTRLMGNRQMSQLSMLDYVIGISIGSIAAEMASHPDGESWYCLVAMAVYAGLAILLNILNDKSLRLRGLILGRPTVLYERGTLYYNNLRGAKLDLSEFLLECRVAGYFDLSQLELVLLEPNGKLSFLPAEGDRPVTPSDMSLSPRQSRPVVPVVMDGAVLLRQLKTVGFDENWLTKQLKQQGFDSLADVFLATVDDTGALSVYEKNEDRESRRYYV